jgi:DNA polymerase-3 subunit beta
MKVSCTIESLREGIAATERVTGKNLTLPILSAILLEADDDMLKMRATNLDIGVEFDVKAKIEKGGSVAVPGSVFSGVISGLRGQKNVKLELVNENLVVSTDNNTTLVKGFPTEDFPTIPVVTSGESFSIPADVLTAGIKSVWFSSAVSDIKPEIASVYMYLKDGEMVFIATDSFRLAEKRIPIQGVTDFSGVIIPVKNVHEVVRVFESVQGDVAVALDENQISFLSGGVYVTSRIVNGVYPDYKQIIPSDFTTDVKILKEDIVSALKLTNVFADKFNKVTLKADPERNVFELSSRNTDVGENMTKIEAAIDGDLFDVNFNYRYLLDGFQSISQDSVLMRFDGKREVLTVQGVSDASFLYLVKPMNK